MWRIHDDLYFLIIISIVFYEKIKTEFNPIIKTEFKNNIYACIYIIQHVMNGKNTYLRKKKKQQSYQNINNTYLKYPSKVDN